MSGNKGPGCLMIGVIVACVLVVVVALLWGTCLSGVLSTGPGAAGDVEPERLIVATEGARMWWESRLETVRAECDELRRAGREQDADALWSATQSEHEDWLALDDVERRRWVTKRIEVTE